MATVQRTCGNCGHRFTKKPGPGRWPKQCYDCRKPDPRPPATKRERRPPKRCPKCDAEIQRQKSYCDGCVCGTITGARRHYRRSEPLCEPCRTASAEHSRQRHQRNAGPRNNNRPCAECGGPLPPGHWAVCSKRCRIDRLVKSDAYQRARTNSYRTAACADCGAKIRTRHSATTTCKPCSQARAGTLGAAARWAQARERRLPALFWGPPTPTVLGKCDLPKGHPARQPRHGDWWEVIVSGPCHVCGEQFTAPTAAGLPKYCSMRCTRWESRHRRRALTKGGSVNRRAVFERDRYRCQICGRKTQPHRDAPHPRATTLDHIVPLVLGGEHTEANSQTACFICNSRKSASVIATGEQLRLIG